MPQSVPPPPRWPPARRRPGFLPMSEHAQGLTGPQAGPSAGGWDPGGSSGQGRFGLRGGVSGVDAPTTVRVAEQTLVVERDEVLMVDAQAGWYDDGSGTMRWWD